MALVCDPKALAAQDACFFCLPGNWQPYVEISLLVSLAGASTDPKTLNFQAVAFAGFNREQSMAAEVYSLAVIAGATTNPGQLQALAKCFICPEPDKIDDMSTYLLAVAAGGSLVPSVLMKAAGQYQRLGAMSYRVRAYLTCLWASSLSLGSGCSAATIANGSKCLANCFNIHTLKRLKAFLLCQIASGAAVGPNLIPPGSTYTCNPTSEFDIAVKPNTNYQICWGANDVSMTFGTTGDVYASTGNGTCIVVYTASNTLMKFAGNACNVAVTATLGISIGSVPIATGLDWFADGTGTNLTANWDAPPSPVAQTEVWTSADGVTYALSTTVNVPGTTASIAGPAIGSFMWAKIRWKAGSQTGIFGAPQMMSGRVTDRIKRVVTTNGGALPTHKNQRSESTFDNTLFNNSIDTLIIELNTFEPSNLTSAICALYIRPGFDHWVNHNFVAGDLTVNGLVGDGATKYLESNTRMIDTSGDNSGGIAGYSFSGGDAGGPDCGFLEGGGHAFNIQFSNTGTSYGECWTFNADGLVSKVQLGFTGYLAVNRIALNSEDLYTANSTTPHSSVSHNANAVVTTRFGGAHPLYVFAANNGAEVATFFSARRLSFMSFHNGMTTAQSLVLFNAIQALRTAFGGGFI